jgi:hypothetical protein
MKPATRQSYTPGVTQIFFPGGTEIIFKSHEMYFVLFAVDVRKVRIRSKMKS